jgi:MFS family permease
MHGMRQVFSTPSVSRFLMSRLVGALAMQIQTVAIGIQVYSITHSALALGLIGLSQFLPFIVCVLIAGHVADRVDRKSIVLCCLLVECMGAIALLLWTLYGAQRAVMVFAILVPVGVVRAFMAPANNALLPNLVKPELFSNAVAISSSTWQIATVAGPALAGVLYATLGPAAVYSLVAVLLAFAALVYRGICAPRLVKSTSPATWVSVVEGLRFVWRRDVVLGAISLDLFAVLFGGSTALLPAYAIDVLHVDAIGLGWLRAAPGIGAAAVAVALAVRPITQRAGFFMFAGVIVFGIATIVFGASTNFWISLLALVILGAADMISVFIRHVLVQLETPDEMRGRVGAVSWMFIGASNEFGEFESGVTGAWWGLKPAVMIGGLATMTVAALWIRWFPRLWKLDRL